MKTRPFRPWAAVPWLPATLCVLAGCGPDVPLDTGPPGRSALSGMDGDHTVAGSEVLNRYAVLSVSASSGDKRLTVANAAALQLQPGDLLLIYQAQGASIDVTNSAAFGAVRDLGSAGRYELVTVGAVNGNQVTLDASCSLRRSYDVRGAVQVVRVPQYRNLTVPQGGRVTAPAWNGSVGGIVAVHVQSEAVVDGDVDTSGLGFRGGRAATQSLDPGSNTDTIASGNPRSGGEKGESIAGDQALYGGLNVRYGRGAPANGGGGGSSHNAPGGGGGGDDNGRPWTGAGVMDNSVTGAAAYQLVPAYIANGNALSNSSGGGRGGYSYSLSQGNNNPDPVRVGPGDARWGGDGRRAVGGLGGRPLQGNPAERVYFGGGGGGGDGNNGAAAPGANGGGLVLLIADSVRGSGALRADGKDGAANVAGFDDAPGGGGGGGTVILSARAPLTSLTLSAAGGRGGIQPNGPVLISEREAEGPGGGGGGGGVYVTLGDGPRSVNGGAGGTSASSVISNFPSNGSTRGASGHLVVSAELNIPACIVQPQGVDMTGGGTVGADLSGSDDGGAGTDQGGAGDGGGGDGGKSYAGGGLTCAAAPAGRVPGGPALLWLSSLVALALGRRRLASSSRKRSRV